MPLEIPATIDAQLAGKSLRIAPLVFFDFLSGPQRYWIGKGDLATGGHTWQGLPVIVAIDFGRPSLNGSAETFSLGVSGVSDAFVIKVSLTQEELVGRACEVSLQFFDDNWGPLDSPFVVRAGRMLGIGYRAGGVKTRSVTVKCESRFTARGLAPLSYLSSQDQLKKFPGNVIFDDMSALEDKTIVWPVF